jgi:hypothetical protein
MKHKGDSLQPPSVKSCLDYCLARGMYPISRHPYSKEKPEVSFFDQTHDVASGSSGHQLRGLFAVFYSR